MKTKIQIRSTKKEKERLQKIASSLNFNLTEYLLKTGLNKNIVKEKTIDKSQINSFLKELNNLSKLGNLLKLNIVSLHNHNKNQYLNGLMEDIEKNKDLIKDLAKVKNQLLKLLQK